jgi:hypothetical protein
MIVRATLTRAALSIANPKGAVQSRGSERKPFIAHRVNQLGTIGGVIKSAQQSFGTLSSRDVGMACTHGLSNRKTIHVERTIHQVQICAAGLWVILDTLCAERTGSILNIKPAILVARTNRKAFRIEFRLGLTNAFVRMIVLASRAIRTYAIHYVVFAVSSTQTNGQTLQVCRNIRLRRLFLDGHSRAVIPLAGNSIFAFPRLEIILARTDTRSQG